MLCRQLTVFGQKLFVSSVTKAYVVYKTGFGYVMSFLLRQDPRILMSNAFYLFNLFIQKNWYINTWYHIQHCGGITPTMSCWLSLLRPWCCSLTHVCTSNQRHGNVLCWGCCHDQVPIKNKTSEQVPIFKTKQSRTRHTCAMLDILSQS